MLTYAKTLSRDPCRIEESKQQFEKAEKLFSVINNEISFREGCNLLFNMQLHYNFTLNDFSTSVDFEQRKNLRKDNQANLANALSGLDRLKKQAEVGGQ